MAVSFPQTATVDWTSLTSMTVSVPLTLMSRLSQAGVDQYTLELVKFYGQFMNLPSQHLEVVEKGLLQAKKFGFSANALFVGTGISLVPSLLARTRGGIAFAAVTMALRASFEANFTARVLSEWLSFFERPAELSLPSVSQLQAVGNEVAGCPIDPEIGRVIWGLEQLIEKNSAPRHPNSKPPRSLISPPHAQDLASAIHTIVTIRPGQSVVMKFKSSVGPSATWLAAFASKTVGLSVSLEIGNKIVWEQQEKYSSAPGSRGHLRLVIEASIDSGTPKQLQVLKSASVEITLQRQESNVETTFRITPQLVVGRMLEEVFDNAEQQNLARECICKAAHHLSQKPAIYSKAAGGSNPTRLTPMYLIKKNQTKSALMLLGIDSDSIDLWTTEAKAVMAKGQTQTIPNKNEPLPKWTMEEDLTDQLGLPFLIAFKRLHDASQQAFSAKESDSWTKPRLDDIKRILALWTVLTFVSTLVPGKDIVNLDGRACNGIESSNGIFSSFDALWRLYYCKLNDKGFIEYYTPAQPTFGTATLSPEGVFKTYCLATSGVHMYAFNLLGGYMDLAGSSNGDTAGVVSGGTFVVMSTLLESNPARPRDAMTIFVGQGAIFVNQQATFCLKSLSRGNYHQPSQFKTTSEFQQFGQTHPYIPGSNDSSDLTEIRMNMSLYVSEKPDISYVAWSLNGRDGTDVLFDLLLTPHEILYNLVHANFIDFEAPASQVPPCFIKKPFSERYKPGELVAENVEELCSGRANSLAQLVMASKNHPAQVLAFHYAFCNNLMVYVCPLDQLESVSPRYPGKAYVIVT